MVRAPDLSLLRQPAFSRLWLARATYVLGWQVQTTALLWAVHQASLAAGHSQRQAVFALGMVGLLQFAPLLLLSLFGGQFADRHNRKHILLACQAAKFCIATGLAAAAYLLSPKDLLGVIYASAAVSGAVNAFQPAAGQALLPMVVDREDLPRAIALTSLAFTVGTVAGPSLGGVLLSLGGPALSGEVIAFTAAAILIFSGAVALTGLRAPHTPSTETRSALDLMREGAAYVWNNKIVLGAISLDLVVVLLGGAQALMPVFATEILQVDDRAYGLLRSGIAIGAALTAIAIAAYPLRRRVGKWMFGSTFVFAAMMIVFGLSTNFWLSLGALIVAGAADMISVQVRQSLIQLATPIAMLGRVASVSFIFISASNELGDFEAGVTGAWLGPVAAVSLGGALAFAAALAWIRIFPQLYRADTFELDPRLSAGDAAAPESGATASGAKAP